MKGQSNPCCANADATKFTTCKGDNQEVFFRSYKCTECLLTEAYKCYDEIPDITWYSTIMQTAVVEMGSAIGWVGLLLFFAHCFGIVPWKWQEPDIPNVNGIDPDDLDMLVVVLPEGNESAPRSQN